MALEDTGLLNQDADPSGTTLIDARNGFNELSHLAMLWTVRRCWMVGARFAFNCYRHRAQLSIDTFIGQNFSSASPLTYRSFS